MKSRAIQKAGNVGSWLFAGVVCANLLMLLLAAIALLHFYDNDTLQAEIQSQNIAQALDQSVSNSIDKVDLSLHTIVNELERQTAAGGLDPGRSRTLISQQKQMLPESISICIFDTHGNVLISAGIKQPLRLNIANQTFFSTLSHNAQAGLVISKPLQIRQPENQAIFLARRFNRADGGFAGVVAVGVPLTYLNRLLSGFDTGRDGVVTLRDVDFGLIVRYPEDSQGMRVMTGDSNVSQSLRALVSSNVSKATYHAAAPYDRIPRVFTFHRIGAAPIYTVAGISEDSYLTEWRHAVRLTIFFFLCFVLVSTTSAWQLNRFWHRQIRDAERLRESAQHLQQAMDELRERNSALIAAQEVGHLGTFALDIATETWTGSSELEGIFGLSPDHPHNLATWQALLHPEDRETISEYLKEEAILKKQVFDREYRIIRPSDGVVRWVHGLGKLEFDRTGTPISMKGAIQDVTERVMAQKAASERLSYILALLATLPDLIWLKDMEGIYLLCNSRFERFFGAKEAEIIGKTDYDFVDQALADDFREHDRKAIQAGVPSINEEWVTFADDGHRELLETIKTPMFDTRGQPLGVLGIARDITERKHNEERLLLASEVFEHSVEMIVVTDAEANILDVNPAFTRVTGYRRDEVMGKNTSMLISPQQSAESSQRMWQQLMKQELWEGELWYLRKDGSSYIQHTRASSVKNAEGETIRLICLGSDVTELRESQQRIEYLAFHDKLTELPNRIMLFDRLRQARALAERRNDLLGVCYLDLDGFKSINDDWGHEAGDRLLIETAARLQGCVRTGDTVARMGGDEFVVLLGSIREPREIELIVQRMLATMVLPFNIGEAGAILSVSVGVTIYPQDQADADTLIRHADQAMYIAKRTGKNRLHMFDTHDEPARVSTKTPLQTSDQEIYRG